jgi:hypothetical protein
VTSNDFFMQQLTQLATEEVVPYLDLQDVSNVALTSKSMFKMFAKPLQIGTLLNLILAADYEKVKNIITRQPEIMFQWAPFKYENHTVKVENISALKLSFSLLDTRMWKICWEAIKDNPNYIAKFFAQSKETKNFLNLEPLFTEYKNYHMQYKRWLRGIIYNTALEQAWLAVGRMQRKILPVHMMKEFCREDITWTHGSSFRVADATCPTHTNVYNYDTGTMTTLFPFTAQAGLGFDFSFIRGDDSDLLKPSVTQHVALGVEHDAAVLRQVYQTRRDEFANCHSIANYYTKAKSIFTP